MGSDQVDDEKDASGFSVKDKRRFNPDGSVRPDAPADGRADETAQAKLDDAARRAAAGAAAGVAAAASAYANEPPADFIGLILSLAQTAMIDLGAAPHPDTGEVQPDLRLARQSIDTVAMLQEKTKGNLTEEEARLLEGVLYQLRLAYVEARRAAQGAARP